MSASVRKEGILVEEEENEKKNMGTGEEKEDVCTEETRVEDGDRKAAAAAEGSAAASIPLRPRTIDKAGVQAVEGILGYQFCNRALVEEALTHVSFYQKTDPADVTGPSYERLEFMGDAVLNCVVAREVFTAYQELSPGPLTKLRSANVDTEKLARVAVGCGLHRFLRHKAPYLDGQIQDFMEAMLDYPIHSNGLLDPPKVLADIVEALLGAVFVDSDSDLETVWKVYKGLSEPLIRLETLGKHPMSELYELCQKKGMTLSFLKDAWTESTAVEVLVDGKLVGRATYGHKKDVALNRAAKAALDHLKLMFADGGGSAGLSESEALQDNAMRRNEAISDHAPRESEETCTATVRSSS